MLSAWFSLFDPISFVSALRCCDVMKSSPLPAHGRPDLLNVGFAFMHLCLIECLVLPSLR